MQTSGGDDGTESTNVSDAEMLSPEGPVAVTDTTCVPAESPAVENEKPELQVAEITIPSTVQR